MATCMASVEKAEGSPVGFVEVVSRAAQAGDTGGQRVLLLHNATVPSGYDLSFLKKRPLGTFPILV